MGLKTIGIPAFVTNSSSVAIQYPMVILYTGINTNSSVTLSAPDSNSLESYVTSKKGTLVCMSTVPTALTSTFGIQSFSAGNSKAALQFKTNTSSPLMRGFDFQEYNDTILYLYDSYATQNSPTVGYKAMSSTTIIANCIFHILFLTVDSYL